MTQCNYDVARVLSWMGVEDEEAFRHTLKSKSRRRRLRTLAEYRAAVRAPRSKTSHKRRGDAA